MTRVLILLGSLLMTLILQAQQIPPYDRDDWMPGGKWEDADGDGQDTRQEVLEKERSYDGWHDPYTNLIFNDPGLLDIDHLVPLAEAHRSGGWRWDRRTKAAYANFLDDEDHLVAVQTRANRQKGDKDPVRWMPPNRTFHCEYIRRWVSIKHRWELEMDPAEAGVIRVYRNICAAGGRRLSDTGNIEWFGIGRYDEY